MKNTVCTALMLLMSVCMYAQELYGEYEKKVYVSSQGDSLKYRLLRPEAEKAGKKYPLVLFLHGAGERGSKRFHKLFIIAIYHPGAIKFIGSNTP